MAVVVDNTDRATSVRAWYPPIAEAGDTEMTDADEPTGASQSQNEAADDESKAGDKDTLMGDDWSPSSETDDQEAASTYSP